MKLETFFEKFELFADAPDAVGKMRELILNFAVTGRLSEKQAADTPVSELIDSLATASAQCTKNRRRKKKGENTDEAEFDYPIAAPSHWAWVPLNEIGAISGGLTPQGYRIKLC